MEVLTARTKSVGPSALTESASITDAFATKDSWAKIAQPKRVAVTCRQARKWAGETCSFVVGEESAVLITNASAMTVTRGRFAKTGHASGTARITGHA